MRAMIWTLALCGLLATSGVARAQEDFKDQPSGQKNRASREPRRDSWSRGTATPPRVMRIETGYVFINDQYLEGPYTLEVADNGVSINGQTIAIAEPQPDPRFRQAPVQRGRALRLASELLSGEGTIVAKDDAQVVLLDQSKTLQMLRVMCAKHDRMTYIEPFVVSLPEQADPMVWRQWLTSFEPSSSLRERAEPLVQQLTEREQIGQSAIAANQRLQAWAYPLTVFGMLAGVVSFGHLLQYPPHGSYDVVPSRRRRDLCRATVLFLVMVVVLSMLDLVWTLLASQAGQMNELNPIGRELMDNPLQLTAFKMVATLMSCGLLMWLRKHPRAQLASWWLCLICTLLTFRWLVLNSMFVA